MLDSGDPAPAPVRSRQERAFYSEDENMPYFSPAEIVQVRAPSFFDGDF